ncbi:hypothetical protein [Micromonospora chokoriensis]|uniref:hypothetical protein n=1 Tax=Micromonospora chokoriensis TaxID=356851 RepID=UPI0004C3EF1F|nr:hypothetical protein [Micromonospora chokoriensis]
MTRAPANLLAVRTLLLTHLDNAPGPDDLDPGEVGIVGDTAHRGGYHCGSDRVVTGDYSVVESPRDRAGLTLDAAALDIGPFDVRSGGRTNTLATFSVWCVAQCVANAADTRDIREIIYSPDGTIVKRWDRLGKRTSGDSSHRWHTHFSFFRDAIKAGRDQRPLFRRYLTSIGLIPGPTTSTEVDMSERASRAIEAWAVGNLATSAKEPVEPVLWRKRDEAYQAEDVAWRKRTDATLAAVLAAAKGLDTKAVLARIDQVAAAESERDAALAELVRRATSGELTAEQVVDELTRRLAS